MEMEKELEKLEMELFSKYEDKKKHLYQERKKMLKDMKDKIPSFWLTVLKKSELMDLINDNDAKVLEYLTNIEIKNNDKGYIIDFEFDENPYFSNKTLSKSIIEDDEKPKSKGTKINWKEGKNLTKEEVIEKNKTKKVDIESFFQYFRDTDEESLEIVPYDSQIEFCLTIRDTVYGKALDFYFDLNVDAVDGINSDSSDGDEQGHKNDSDDDINNVD